MAATRRSLRVLLLLGGLAVAVVLIRWGLAGFGGRSAPAELAAVRATPPGIMGTRCELTVVVPADRADAARRALASAENALRDVEALMSDRLTDSALSRFNAAGAGEQVPLPGPLVDLIRRAVGFSARSEGAFDVTCRPVVELWRRSARAVRPPAQQQIAEARKRVGSRHLKIGPDGAAKLADGLQIDLGGIAKGHGIDRAAETLQSAEAAVGGIVNVGGDLRCWGRSAAGRAWRVGIQHPFREDLCGTLRLTDAAVATSGDYRRGFRIAGRRYSHIVDPRTGRPVEQTHSVTVVSLPAAGRKPSATAADAWATALSVLGPAGAGRMRAEPGLEAMIVTGTADDPSIHLTEGFRRLLAPDGKIKLD